MATLAEILQTENSEQQAQLVQKLLAMAQAPFIGMTILVDTRLNNKVDILANNLPIEQAYLVLDAARNELLRREREAAKQKPEQPSTEPGE